MGVSAKVSNVARQGRQAADVICDWLDNVYDELNTTMTVKGKFSHGTANTAPTGDAYFYGSTATKYIQWDYSADQFNVLANMEIKALEGTDASVTQNWGFKIVKSGSDLYIKYNATSLSTASTMWHKLTMTSVFA